MSPLSFLVESKWHQNSIWLHNLYSTNAIYNQNTAFTLVGLCWMSCCTFDFDPFICFGKSNCITTPPPNLFCSGSLVCIFILNGSTGLPVKQGKVIVQIIPLHWSDLWFTQTTHVVGHRNGQTHNPVIDEDLNWDPTKAHGINMWVYSGLVGPRSVRNATHHVDQQSSSDVAPSGSGNEDQNGDHNPLVFERVFQFHPGVSAVSNYMPFSGAQPEYLSDTWWHNFLRDDD